MRKFLLVPPFLVPLLWSVAVASQGTYKAAANLDTVRAVAAEAGDMMLEEIRDWFVVMRIHDFELQV